MTIRGFKFDDFLCDFYEIGQVVRTKNQRKINIFNLADLKRSAVLKNLRVFYNNGQVVVA